MAHFWIRESDGGWAILTVPVDGVTLDERVLRRQHHAAADGAEPIRVAAAGDDGADVWMLVAPAGVVRVNGSRIASGLSVLRHRDQIAVPGFEPVFFSTEQLAAIQPCPSSERRLKCPRCQQDIAAETLAVCCPGCGVWHHQSAQLECWTYASSCALCPQPTDLDAGYQWTPEHF